MKKKICTIHKHSMSANRNSVCSNIHTNSCSRHIQWCKHMPIRESLNCKWNKYMKPRDFKCSPNPPTNEETRRTDWKYLIRLCIYIYEAPTWLVRAVGNQNGAQQPKPATKRMKPNRNMNEWKRRKSVWQTVLVASMQFKCRTVCLAQSRYRRLCTVCNSYITKQILNNKVECNSAYARNGEKHGEKKTFQHILNPTKQPSRTNAIFANKIQWENL